MGLDLSKAYDCPTNLHLLPLHFMIDDLYVSCTRVKIDAQYDASIRDLRNCDDLTLLLAAVKHSKPTHPTQHANHAESIFRNHAPFTCSGLMGQLEGEMRRGLPSLPIASLVDHDQYHTAFIRPDQARPGLSPSPKPSRPLIISLAAAVLPRLCCGVR